MAADKPDANGRWGDFWSKLTDPRTVVMLVLLGVAISGWFFAVQGHCADDTVHHTYDGLDIRYVRDDLYRRDQTDVQQSLQRIEQRVDKIADKLNVN